jgi:hypothetical protein
LLGSKGVKPIHHLNERMALFLVDNASLNLSEAAENASNLTFRSASTAYE